MMIKSLPDFQERDLFGAYWWLVICLLVSVPMIAQPDSTTVQDAPYSRPFITVGKSATAVGGYVEGNTNYFQEDGISEGFNMELRRFNIFLYSTISQGVRFLSELEFEHGTEEIALETAQVDIDIFPALTLRGGIMVVPIGAYNQNHDSPKWDFVERPLVSTEIIPSTFSEIGFGINGRSTIGGAFITYDLYLVNGLTDGVILNDEGRTFLQAGKSEERFAEDNNGSPATTGRIAFRSHTKGELGLSFYHGAYNSYKLEGESVEEKQNLSIFALDIESSIGSLETKGEFALNILDVPESLQEIYGDKQWGGYLEVLYPLMQRPIFNFKRAVLESAIRLERIDYNVGKFEVTNQNIGDDVTAIAFALAFRPSADTVLRANYRHHWIKDAIGNPTVRSAGFQFGVATYF